MKPWIVVMVVVVVGLLGSASGVRADAEGAEGDQDMAGPGSVAVGYHDAAAPIGVRYWFSNGTIGLDGGFGLSVERVVLVPQGTTSTLLGYTFSVGLPIMFKSWRKLHVLFRPGGSFGQNDEVFQQLTNDIEQTTFDVVAKRTSFDARFELEVEYFLVQRFSVSVSHGAQYTTSKLNVASDIRNINAATTANDFSNIGFHVYLWGVK